jgi:hypothetical protein
MLSFIKQLENYKRKHNFVRRRVGTFRSLPDIGHQVVKHLMFRFF